ncbi:MAG: PAS-domain containing protein [Paracoccaceae bacterium]
MDLIDPRDSLEKQNEKLLRITRSLMRRVEQAPDQAGMAYAQFERAALLEEQVRQRTNDLERALDLLHQSNARLELANTEAREARENLAQAVETIDEGFAMFDDDDRLVMYNSRFCQDLPDVRLQLRQGTDFTEYVRLISDSAHLAVDEEETRESWRTKRLRLHEKPHAVFNIRLERNRWIQVSEHRTETSGTVVLQTDVTQIMRLERRERAKLIEQQALMLRGTLDHLYQGVCIFDAQGCLVGWNQRMEHLLNRPLEEKFREMPFGDLLELLEPILAFSGPTTQQDLRNWSDISAGRAPLRFEVVRKDGAIFDVFVQEMPDTGFVISFSDVTQERHTSNALRNLNETLERRVEERTTALGEALEDARRANASKNRFVAAVGHDLMQPLSAAKLFAASLEDRTTNETDRQIAVKTISALTNAEALIDALMDISKLDLGLASYELTPVRLDTLMMSLVSEFAPMAAEKGIVLRAVPVAAVVISDRVYLRRILQNLLSNALRYTTGTKVLVGARRIGDQMRVDVIDQGPGLSEADQQLIFQEFKQLPTNTAHGDGLGLGLAIVERASRMLGHGLQLASTLGKGSRFSICADVWEGHLTDGSEPDDHPAPVPPLQSHVVMLVENDPDLAHSISLILTAFGSDVVHASSGEEALELVQEMGVVPDGFLLDYQLSDGMNGLDLAQALRKAYGDVPIQIISANRSDHLTDTCVQMNLPLCRKPITREELRAFLGRLTDRTRQF